MGKGQHSHHHIVPFNTYVKVFVSLLVLTVITVAVTQLDFGRMWNTIIAMIIASVKATLVLAFFMHLKYDDKLNRAIFGTGLFFLAILLFSCLTDIYTRFNQTPQ